MTFVHTLCFHYSATYEDQDVHVEDIRAWHIARGFRTVGYHYVGPLGGGIEIGRSPETRRGAGVGGHNTNVIHTCFVGGLKRATGGDVGHDTRTREQKDTQITHTRALLSRHPQARVVGHRDLGNSQCPGYDVGAWWAGVNGRTVKPKAVDITLPTYSFAMTKRGSRGKAVRVLQEALNLLGFSVGAVDGSFGPKTDRAVRGFQSHVGITADGMVGPVTWTEIFKAKG